MVVGVAGDVLFRFHYHTSYILHSLGLKHYIHHPPVTQKLPSYAEVATEAEVAVAVAVAVAEAEVA